MSVVNNIDRKKYFQSRLNNSDIIKIFSSREETFVKVKKIFQYSKIPILRSPFGLSKSALVNEVVLISNMIS